MKLLKGTLVLIVISLIAYSNSFSMKTPSLNKKDGAKVFGTVTDDQNKPLEFVNVAVYKKNDSTLVTGNASGKEGKFEISGLPKGEYYLTFSMVGYGKKFINSLVVDDKTGEINLGTIKLESKSIQMNEREVVGERQLEEFKIDKRVINVAKDMTVKGGTALDVLQNQPSVRVDADGTVFLRGSSSFVLQVNGRPHVMQGSDGLRQIPANMIENIELVTNPSAKNDAEGSAGIINVILKKQVENNFNSLLNIGAGSRDKYNADFNTNYKIDNINYTFGVDYRKSSFYNDQTIDRKTMVSNEWLPNLSELNLNFVRNNYSGRAGVEVTMGNSVLTVNGAVGGFKMDFNSLTKINAAVKKDSSYFGRNTNDNEFDVKYYNGGMFFSHSFVPKVSEFTLDAYITRVTVPSEELTKEYKADNSFNPLSSTPYIKLVNNDTKRWDGRIKANYKLVFDPKSNIEAGLQSSLFFKNMDYKNQEFNWTTNQYDLNAGLSNMYDFTNNIYSGFVTFANSLIGIDYQLGLRTEYTDRELNQKTIGKSYTYKKAHVFPSVNLSTKIGMDQQFQFSYARRINRPFEQSLNPFPQYSDSYTESKGNPELLPEFSNSFELNYQKYFTGHFLSVQTYYRQTDDVITRTSENQNGKLLLSFKNFAKSSAVGAEISGSTTIAPWLRLDPGINLFHYSIQGTVGNDNIDNKNFTWNMRLNTTITLSSDTRIQVSGYYNAKNLFAQGEMEPFYFLTFAVRQDLFEKKLSINLQAQNLINSGKMKISQTGSNFTNEYRILNEQPIFMLTLSYNLNNFKRTQRPQDNVDLNIGTGI